MYSYLEQLACETLSRMKLKNLINLLFSADDTLITANDKYGGRNYRRGVELRFIQHGITNTIGVEILENVIVKHTDLNSVIFIDNYQKTYELILGEIYNYNLKKKGGESDVETYTDDDPVFNLKASPHPTSAFYGTSKKGLEELKKDIEKLRQGRE